MPFITYRGYTRTVADWAKRTGISHKTLYYRVKQGWSAWKILGKNGPLKKAGKPKLKKKKVHVISRRLYEKALRQIPDFYVDEFIKKFKPLIKK